MFPSDIKSTACYTTMTLQCHFNLMNKTCTSVITTVYICMIPETNKGQAQLYRIDQPGKRLCRHLEMSNDIISLKVSV